MSLYPYKISERTQRTPRMLNEVKPKHGVDDTMCLEVIREESVIVVKQEDDGPFLEVGMKERPHGAVILTLILRRDDCQLAILHGHALGFAASAEG